MLKVAELSTVRLPSRPVASLFEFSGLMTFSLGPQFLSFTPIGYFLSSRMAHTVALLFAHRVSLSFLPPSFLFLARVSPRAHFPPSSWLILSSLIIIHPQIVRERLSAEILEAQRVDCGPSAFIESSSPSSTPSCTSSPFLPTLELYTESVQVSLAASRAFTRAVKEVSLSDASRRKLHADFIGSFPPDSLPRLLPSLSSPAQAQS